MRTMNFLESRDTNGHNRQAWYFIDGKRVSKREFGIMESKYCRFESMVTKRHNGLWQFRKVGIIEGE